jgi:hypothetical protein
MEKTIDRIRKLLALANNNSSEAERQSALAKAHAMLLEHNLSQADIAGDDAVEETVDAATFGYKFNTSPWSRWICSAIAELYFCKFYWTRSPSQTLIVTFVGTRADVEVAHSVAKMILSGVWAGALIAAKANMQLTAARARTDFTNAAAKTIYWRCKELIKQAKEGGTAESDGRALVVVNLYEAKMSAAQAWVDNNVKLAKPRKAVTVNRYSAASEAGREHGAKAQLTMSVGADKKPAATKTAGLLK